jgi:hypothetical protein
MLNFTAYGRWAEGILLAHNILVEPSLIGQHAPHELLRARVFRLIEYKTNASSHPASSHEHLSPVERLE